MRHHETKIQNKPRLLCLKNNNLEAERKFIFATKSHYSSLHEYFVLMWSDFLTQCDYATIYEAGTFKVSNWTKLLEANWPTQEGKTLKFACQSTHVSRQNFVLSWYQAFNFTISSLGCWKTRILLSDFAEQLCFEITDVASTYLILFDVAGNSPILVLSQNHKP